MGLFSKADNEVLTRTGPGTPMGKIFRQYWVPALLAEILPDDEAAPLEFKLLHEPLRAWRSADGVAVITGERRSYPTHEGGRLIWVHMGDDGEETPPFPGFCFANLPDEKVVARIYNQPCNWLQGVEGDVDFAHAGWLHGTFSNALGWGNPKVGFIEEGASLRIIADLPMDEAKKLVAKLTFHLPCMTGGDESTAVGGLFHAWVPIDDENHYLLYIHFDTQREFSAEERDEIDIAWGHDKIDYDNGLRSIANPSNGHLQNWQRFKPDIFSGISGIAAQDVAMLASMGPIVDRSKENLGQIDMPIIQLRRYLLRMAELAQTQAELPPFYDDLKDGVGHSWTAPLSAKWQDVVAGNCPEAVLDPTPPHLESWLVADSLRAIRASSMGSEVAR